MRSSTLLTKDSHPLLLYDSPQLNEKESHLQLGGVRLITNLQEYQTPAEGCSNAILS